MKLVGLILLLGLIPVYFLEAALKVSMWSMEMMIHNSIRFFAGFLVLGIGVFYEHVIRLKTALLIVLMLVGADYISDYLRGINTHKLEFAILGVYMLSWGSVTGYVFIKQIKKYSQMP
ncbi:hypothetical protein [Methylosarcina fibrata]|uniref:hypothetical protein n=1 Tax=Methylosarcina fibrata TaxID=105972 RepID=UPI000367EDAC|nr:hypothetical protein [Methylosarcina fibrata]